ncbi:plastocyanin [Dyadobacter sp. BE34]|uniref:Plastocyanin n=1 Tax=Dyadobacter fermentans TaxID=94254 RepID=A0ABU1QWW5_9BACT|nr:MULTISPECIES: plastocyanin/azurin family copper-binding protein [Dyadobacter]MDR6804790.1 plastocyanin [Dyadobacter fermentans]MDR7043451.1 plastocyanin [Dyadobacter sp. BE242]MDR7197763.1 plastocyanin [Dyadobacter sp. BE34]MDR7214804.1 plastocyanin [Dyadobacter sp. BE31]MDR7262339.1 plastocyanin [Dyadobacter sp. BE32]
MNWPLRISLTIILLTADRNASHLIGYQNNPNTSSFVANHVVEVRQMAFVPSSITVRKGERVTFINRDIVRHDITEEKKAWQSRPLGTGKSWTFTVMRSADYYCSIHPVMKGKITVK